MTLSHVHVEAGLGYSSFKMHNYCLWYDSGGRAKIIHIKTSEVSVCMTFSILVSIVFTYLCVYFYILSLFVHNACKNHPESVKTVIGLEFCFMHNLIQLIQDLKNIKNVKRCRDGMPKSMQTR